LKLTEIAAKQIGVDVYRIKKAVDIGLVYDETNAFLKKGQEVPVIRIYWDGWEMYSKSPEDTISKISKEHLSEAGKTISLALMIMGREQE
jgi:hypothetical protein